MITNLLLIPFYILIDLKKWVMSLSVCKLFHPGCMKSYKFSSEQYKNDEPVYQVYCSCGNIYYVGIEPIGSKRVD